MTVKRFILLVTALAGFISVVFVLYVTAERSFVLETGEPTAPTPTFDTFSFPYSVGDSSIVLQAISAYEGPYLEDGSDDEVVDIAALKIYNSGMEEISNLYIELLWENGSFVFEGDHIPPDATVVLLERNRGLFHNYCYKACNIRQEIFKMCDIQDQIAIAEEGLGTVTVTNLTDRTLLDVNVYYKSWLNPPDVYVGGITYKTEIPQLLPQQTVSLSPYHYACGYNKVVTVTTDRSSK